MSAPLAISRLLKNTPKPVRVEPFGTAQGRLRNADSKHGPHVDPLPVRFDRVACAINAARPERRGPCPWSRRISANGFFQPSANAHGPDQRLTRRQRAVIKATERARRRATSQQCPGASPGRRLERITSPRFLAPQARGGHESRASQVVARRVLSPASTLAVHPSNRSAVGADGGY